MPWKVRPTQEVLGDGAGTRRRSFDVDGTHHTLEFGKEPVYLDVLPPEIEQDPHLLTKEVTEEEMATAGGVLTRLKAERVQDPMAPIAASDLEPEPIDPEPDPDLKAERIQEEAVAPEEGGGAPLPAEGRAMGEGTGVRSRKK
jgi:hypothetical protein